MQAYSLIEPQSRRLIYIHADVIKLIDQYRQTKSSTTEAGGILLGKRRGVHFEIIYATEPQSNDIRCRNKFIRSSEGHQEIANEHWIRSDGEINYLGEWHTHPEALPQPSKIDLKEWQLKVTEHAVPLVFMIKGFDKSYCGLQIENHLLRLSDLSS